MSIEKTIEKSNKLEKNIAILNRDLTQITDMMLRYAKSDSATLVEIAKNLKTSRDALVAKKSQLDRKWVELNFEVDDDVNHFNLQDYREVL